jgi:outer membrane protein
MTERALLVLLYFSVFSVAVPHVLHDWKLTTTGIAIAFNSQNMLFTTPNYRTISHSGVMQTLITENSMSSISEKSLIQQFARRYPLRFIHMYRGFLIFIFLLMLTVLTAPAHSLAQGIEQGEMLTLDKAIDIALKNQPSITAGRFAVRASDARINEALSPYYPQISASTSYSKVSPATSGPSNAGTYESYSASAGLNQLISDFGKTATQVRISKLNNLSSKYDLTTTQETVTYNVKQAYYTVLQTMRNRIVVQQTVNQFQEHLQQAQGFFEAGTKAKFDVTKAEVDLSNARLNAITADNLVKQAYVTLKNAMGLPEVPDFQLENNLLYVPYELPVEQAIEKAYVQRPDLQSIIMKREASKESINLIKKGFYPTLSANGGYQHTGTAFPLNRGWNYGLSLSVPIFNGFITKNQVSEAEANLGTISANEQTLRLDIYSQVQQGYLSLRAAAERIRASELGVRQATENVELASGRYEAGVGGPLEVTDAIVAKANAEVAHTSALTDYKIAQAAIEKAIGEKR